MKLLPCAAVLFLSMLFAVPAGATTIAYQTINLADTVPGQDLWEYHYTVTGQSFLANQGFTIYFDPQFYTLLEDPAPTVNGDWDIFVAQPNAAGMLQGFYDAFALVDSASLADPFVLTFVWLGGPSVPGSQPTTINQFDQDGNLLDAVPGHTVPAIEGPVAAVPEPTTLVLFTAGGLVAFARRRRQ